MHEGENECIVEIEKKVDEKIIIETTDDMMGNHKHNLDDQEGIENMLDE